MAASFLRSLQRDRIQIWPERDRALTEYEHVAVMPVGGPARRGPVGDGMDQ